MKLSTCVAATSLLLGLVFGLIIDKNTFYHDPVIHNLEFLRINRDVFVSYINVSDLSLSESFQNYGDFYFTNALEEKTFMKFAGLYFHTENIFAFDALRAQNSFFQAEVTVLTNSGQMFVGISGESLESKIDIVSTQLWENSVSMVLQGSLQYHLPPLTLGNLDENREFSIVNTGSICYYGLQLKSITSATGFGCIFVGEKSQFRLEIVLRTNLRDQTIYLDSPDSKLYIEMLENPDQTLVRVLGFQDNIIFRGSTEVRIGAFTPSLGLWLIYRDGVRILLVLGQGYNELYLKWDAFENGYVLKNKYKPPRQIVPLNCNCPNSFPVAPVEPSSSSTSSTFSSESFASTSASVASTDLPLSSTSATPSALSSISSTDSIMSSSGSSDYPVSSISSKASSMSSASQTSPALSSVPHLSSVSSTDSHVSSESSTSSATSSESFSHSAASLAMTSASSLSSAKPVSSGASG
ncbi:hypothetical protein METBIDRAFT_223058, partial [Metschnikowia bicuspidata var. bicuspidata NRRL YB-4993]